MMADSRCTRFIHSHSPHNDRTTPPPFQSSPTRPSVSIRTSLRALTAHNRSTLTNTNNRIFGIDIGAQLQSINSPSHSLYLSVPLSLHGHHSSHEKATQANARAGRWISSNNIISDRPERLREATGQKSIKVRVVVPNHASSIL